jgi:hypothetical protein
MLLFQDAFGEKLGRPEKILGDYCEYISSTK